MASTTHAYNKGPATARALQAIDKPQSKARKKKTLLVPNRPERRSHNQKQKLPTSVLDLNSAQIEIAEEVPASSYEYFDTGSTQWQEHTDIIREGLETILRVIDYYFRRRFIGSSVSAGPTRPERHMSPANTGSVGPTHTQ
ncbi:hypothetical protein O0L34_g1952 [Tuta absoluta]|nr:hypothetical protein O0L34_g1952 [Tuta absoluta]